MMCRGDSSFEHPAQHPQLWCQEELYFFAVTLEGPAWDGTFEGTHIHPEYGLPVWGASLWGWFRVLSTVTGAMLWVPLCWR